MWPKTNCLSSVALGQLIRILSCIIKVILTHTLSPGSWSAWAIFKAALTWVNITDEPLVVGLNAAAAVV